MNERKTSAKQKKSPSLDYPLFLSAAIKKEIKKNPRMTCSNIDMMDVKLVNIRGITYLLGMTSFPPCVCLHSIDCHVK